MKKKRSSIALLSMIKSATIFSLAITTAVVAIQISDKPIQKKSTQLSNNMTTKQDTIDLPSANRTLQLNQAGSKRPANRKNQGSPKSLTSTNRTTQMPPARSNSATISSQQQQDPLALAQQQLRLMMNYNNTPPLFVTRTRDFFVDVARYPLGTKLTTMNAVDIDGDPLEYSLQPANLRDASPYFSIDSSSGELRLANKPFVFQHEQSLLNRRAKSTTSNESSQLEGSTTKDSDEDVEDEDAEDSVVAEEDRSSTETEVVDDGLLSRNLYFLNVAADDGSYTSSVELQIHVINSSYLTSLHHSGKGSLVHLTPDGSRRTSEQMDSINRQKTKEFYDKLVNLPAQLPANSSNQSATIVYPNYVNPSIIRPQQQSTNLSQQDSLLPAISAQQTVESDNHVRIKSVRTSEFSQPEQIRSADEHNTLMSHQASRGATFSGDLPISIGQDKQHQLDQQALMTPPMIVSSLVIACSCLMIALVLLLFIVPLSVKRLRKRLKHVELQHQHLSKQNSNNSSTICSSSSTSAGSSMVTHSNHVPSLSQFTLSSDGRSCTMGDLSVCRQSSLDSTIISSPSQSMMFRHNQPPKTALNRVNNGSIANPIYLQQQHQQARLLGLEEAQLIQQHAYLLQSECQPVVTGSNNANNIYYPLDDNFYSDINTDSPAGLESSSSQAQELNIVHQANTSSLHSSAIHMTEQQLQLPEQTGYFMAQCTQPELFERPVESPSSDSGSSTRSLARFLSLPARHSYHTQSNGGEPHFFIDNSNLSPELSTSNHASCSKTIARASNIAREQQITSNQSSYVWELERHRLRFLNLIDEGQFGQVWRCKLRLPSTDTTTCSNNTEQTVAVKTLKTSASKDERGREDLLAEIEIMKLVCKHPNVVKMLHCCTSNSQLVENAPILLVMEYVELGKLQSFLKSSRVNHHYATTTNATTSLQQQHYNNLTGNTKATSSSDHLTSRDLIKFIYHVAKGMEYISSQCIVHRDLASRNILVSTQRICKIGDFGMARHMQSFGGVYERHSRNTKVPVRWMAPEVLLNNRFTTKSDVYSFGILMWEIVTLGSTPYRYLKTEQVIEEVARNGQRPGKPEYCHSQLYELMSRCWLHDPDKRPTFNSLVKQLDELLLSSNDYIELDQYPDHNYYNIPQTAAPNELL